MKWEICPSSYALCDEVNPFSLQLRMSRVQLILVVFSLISMVSHLVLLPIFKFNIRWYYGIYLYVLYVAFLTCAILVELKIIPE